MKKYMIMLLVIAVIIIIILGLKNVILKRIYPLKYEEIVGKYAEAENIDPLLVFAIIKAESNFEPNITSKSGAMGLMQVMNLTGQEVAEGIDVNFSTKEVLYNPETNINIGVKYFSNLLKKYEGNMHLALAAYNAGIRKCGKMDK